MSAYYGGRNVSHHRNIVWSNGALDPWSGQGVFPTGGGPDGPLVQNISAGTPTHELGDSGRDPITVSLLSHYRRIAVALPFHRRPITV